ncbi:MAG: hypothetical protein KIT80_16475 [Chitinophagaceae bacterium]|nr:hypothetical protein [Chitinophagaceae bacterium]MCW5928514.1 hypothetical protein [Chitinophagaceae bacterium]
MSTAKIQLSEDELQLAQNSDIILTKNLIIEKAGLLLGELIAGFSELAKDIIAGLPAESRSPKISKGEHYLGLPYVILDFPRHFKRHEILAIRTMFWWGNHFSITLHLKGIYRDRSLTSVINFSQSPHITGNWLLQTTGDEWQHHPGRDTHQYVRDIPQPQLHHMCSSLTFIKLSYFLPVNEWNNAAQLLTERFEMLAGIIRH